MDSYEITGQVREYREHEVLLFDTWKNELRIPILTEEEIIIEQRGSKFIKVPQCLQHFPQLLTMGIGTHVLMSGELDVKQMIIDFEVLIDAIRMWAHGFTFTRGVAISRIILGEYLLARFGGKGSKVSDPIFEEWHYDPKRMRESEYLQSKVRLSKTGFTTTPRVGGRILVAATTVSLGYDWHQNIPYNIVWGVNRSKLWARHLWDSIQVKHWHSFANVADCERYMLRNIRETWLATYSLQGVHRRNYARRINYACATNVRMDVMVEGVNLSDVYVLACAIYPPISRPEEISGDYLTFRQYIIEYMADWIRRFRRFVPFMRIHLTVPVNRMQFGVEGRHYEWLGDGVQVLNLPLHILTTNPSDDATKSSNMLAIIDYPRGDTIHGLSGDMCVLRWPKSGEPIIQSSVDPLGVLVPHEIDECSAMNPPGMSWDWMARTLLVHSWQRILTQVYAYRNNAGARSQLDGAIRRGLMPEVVLETFTYSQLMRMNTSELYKVFLATMLFEEEPNYTTPDYQLHQRDSLTPNAYLNKSTWKELSIVYHWVKYLDDTEEENAFIARPMFRTIHVLLLGAIRATTSAALNRLSQGRWKVTSVGLDGSSPVLSANVLDYRVTREFDLVISDIDTAWIPLESEEVENADRGGAVNNLRDLATMPKFYQRSWELYGAIVKNALASNCHSFYVKIQYPTMEFVTKNVWVRMFPRLQDYVMGFLEVPASSVGAAEVYVYFRKMYDGEQVQYDANFSRVALWRGMTFTIPTNYGLAPNGPDGLRPNGMMTGLDIRRLFNGRLWDGDVMFPHVVDQYMVSVDDIRGADVDVGDVFVLGCTNEGLLSTLSYLRLFVDTLYCGRIGSGTGDVGVGGYVTWFSRSILSRINGVRMLNRPSAEMISGRFIPDRTIHTSNIRGPPSVHRMQLVMLDLMLENLSPYSDRSKMRTPVRNVIWDLGCRVGAGLPLSREHTKYCGVDRVESGLPEMKNTTFSVFELTKDNIPDLLTPYGNWSGEEPDIILAIDSIFMQHEDRQAGRDVVDAFITLLGSIRQRGTVRPFDEQSYSVGMPIVVVSAYGGDDDNGEILKYLCNNQDMTDRYLSVRTSDGNDPCEGDTLEAISFSKYSPVSPMLDYLTQQLTTFGYGIYRDITVPYYALTNAALAGNVAIDADTRQLCHFVTRVKPIRVFIP
jgi:hypothetical protein